MIQNTRTIYKLIASVFVIAYLFFLRINQAPTIMAWLLIIFSLLLLIKVREDIFLIFLSIPIAYANYSIAVGEFIEGNLIVSLNMIRNFNYELYIDSLLMLCIFVFLFFIFIRPNVKNNQPIVFKKNSVIFGVLFFLLFIIDIFFFDRSFSENYIVRSTSLHGYIFILLLFLIYYSGNSPIKKTLILIYLFFNVTQSLVFGGRGAALPNAIIVLLMMFPKKLNKFLVFIVTVMGVVLLTAVGTIRLSDNGIDISNILTNFSQNLFVQDTSLYAFNSSVTHLATTDILSKTDRFASFFAFLSSILVGGSSEFTMLSNATNVSDVYFNNLGGGIISTHFYFWLGWIGVFVAPLLTVFTINRLNHSTRVIHKLTILCLVASTSTWYIYSPLQFFRIIIIFVPLLYILFKVFDSIIKSNKLIVVFKN